ncbi:MAG: hypothetical protein AB7V62_12015 [Thermoleophilia bacterium]
MRSTTSQGQLLLFPGAVAPPGAERPGAAAAPPRARRRTSPSVRKADALDRMAAAAEHELAEAWRSGDMLAAKDAHDRARGARRAAQLLRAGPRGVAGVIGGEPEAA